MRKEILITGGAGYIGSHTVVSLINSGYVPIIVDDFRNSNREVLDGIQNITGETVQYYPLDLNNKPGIRNVFDRHKFHGVIHFAAYKSVGESVSEPLKYYRNNVDGLLTIVELMLEYGTRNFIFSSSCTLYEEVNTSSGVGELTPIGFGDSPYAATKRMGEQILEDVCKAFSGFNCTNLRYFNPIGAHPSGLIGELPQGIPNNLIPYLTQTAIGNLEQLRVFGKDYETPDGTCIRDYVHVCDIADAHVSALNRSLNSSEQVFDIYNLGTGRGTSVLDIIHTFEKVSEVNVNWSFGEPREGDRPQIFANAEKANVALNWNCKFSIEDALRHAWNWELNRAELSIC
jgi:UDP-glucose 4-epimerase